MSLSLLTGVLEEAVQPAERARTFVEAPPLHRLPVAQRRVPRLHQLLGVVAGAQAQAGTTRFKLKALLHTFHTSNFENRVVVLFQARVSLQLRPTSASSTRPMSAVD